MYLFCIEELFWCFVFDRQDYIIKIGIIKVVKAGQHVRIGHMFFNHANIKLLLGTSHLS